MHPYLKYEQLYAHIYTYSPCIYSCMHVMICKALISHLGLNFCPKWKYIYIYVHDYILDPKYIQVYKYTSIYTFMCMSIYWIPSIYNVMHLYIECVCGIFNFPEFSKASFRNFLACSNIGKEGILCQIFRL